MHNNIKALGPAQSKKVPFKSSTREVITDKSKQTERIKHYSNLFSRKNTVPASAVDVIKAS